MQNNVKKPIKEALIEFAKYHNENYGKIMEICNHLEKAVDELHSLPNDIQNELGQILLNMLATNGILAISLKRN